MPKSKAQKRLEAAHRAVAASGFTPDKIDEINAEYLRLVAKAKDLSASYKLRFGDSPHFHDIELDLGCRRCEELDAVNEATKAELFYLAYHRAIITASQALANIS